MAESERAVRLLERGLAEDRRGREAEAVYYYRQALKAGLDVVHRRVALICLASSHREIGQLDEALSVIETARYEYPHDAVVEAFAALIMLDSGQAGKAVQILGLALCEHARPESLAGFDEALTRKFGNISVGGIDFEAQG